jgi:hypothetical protein
LQQFTFSEVAPATAGTAASSQAVTGSPSFGMPAGVAGLFDDYESIDVDAEINANTGGTLAVYLQTSPDGGISWYDVIAWQIAPAASGVKFFRSPLSQATTTSTTVQVGKNLSPALASTTTTSTVVNGAFSDRCRLVMVSGSGTSVGGAVVVRLCAQRSRLREAGGD